MKEVKEGYKMTELGEIPNEWQIKSLKEVTEIVSGGTPDTKNNDYWEDGQILWATPTDITSNGKYIYDTLNKITEEGLKNSSANMLPVGAILMTSRATIGERCITKVPIATNQGFKSFICKEDLNNEFLYYLLGECQKDFLALAAGSTFVEISKSAVEKYKCILPTLPEQQKIADILSTVDEQIDNVDRLIEKTKELKKGLMQQLLTKGIGHTEFKETEVGVIPKEWEVKRLEEVCENITIGLVKTMTKYYVHSGIPLIRNSDIKENCIICNDMINLDEKFAEENKDKKLKLGDVVTVHTGDICTSAVVEDNLVGAHGFATLHSTVLKDVINNYYLSWYLNSEVAKKQAYSFSTGDGRNNLNLKDFVKIIIPVPNKMDEQLKIVDILNEIYATTNELSIKKEKLQQLKKGLMQQLLTGKIRVKVDEV